MKKRVIDYISFDNINNRLRLNNTLLMQYNPTINSREQSKYYISASEEDIEQMLKEIGLSSLDDLYKHIPDDIKFEKELNLPKSKSSQTIIEEISSIAKKNKIGLSFIGDGLKTFSVPKVSEHILNIRELTTSYTPYQPERSQGTLMTHWIYQCLIAQITGFEAINASMYDRSTAIVEAILCARRIKRNQGKVLIANNLFPNDLEVIKTHFVNDTDIEFLPFDTETSLSILDYDSDDILAVVFSQINCFGHLDDVDKITNFAHKNEALAIAIVEPILLGQGGLKPPVEFGDNGADIFVAEGQNLAIDTNFGGPGLGIFGIRYNKQTAKYIRSTAGRFVGNAKDLNGKECKVIILSTREQHIKREKANSNICSNQAYIATVAGAALLERGEDGLKKLANTSRQNALCTLQKLLAFEGVNLAFEKAPFFNEFTLKVNKNVDDLIYRAQKENISIGVNTSSRLNESDGYLTMAFNDFHSMEDIESLVSFFSQNFNRCGDVHFNDDISRYQRGEKIGLLSLEVDEIKRYYEQLAKQNISPDSSIYPLGSCTMKYNPYLNDFCAGFSNFQKVHPQSDASLSQGCLEILYNIQEYFKIITGLPAVTTQPVAGAQGELVGLKLFQAYHRDRGEERDIILIPKSAHGTNPATAAMAGFVKNRENGIVLVNAQADGRIDFAHCSQLIETYNKRICGIMITNPNTSGIFETSMKEIASLIHKVGGLVYMDGANMNAIAGWIDLGKIGVDAVHNNLHKTWSIPHGGGGPGDAIVAVSEKLIPYLPGYQIEKEEGVFSCKKMEKSIGSFHRHFGNFAHKVRCYAYLLALGSDGIKQMSAIAVLSARYLYEKLSEVFETIPYDSHKKIMHEFIITLSKESFTKIEEAGINSKLAISRFGKLFLDFGFHAPTVSFPETFGLMIEPTESYTKAELDRFIDALYKMKELLDENAEVLQTVPHFTPIERVDDVIANRNPQFNEKITELPPILQNRLEPEIILTKNLDEIKNLIIEQHSKVS